MIILFGGFAGNGYEDRTYRAFHQCFEMNRSYDEVIFTRMVNSLTNLYG